jgi:hypothetical protein
VGENLYYILMADVIGSREMDGITLMNELKSLIKKVSADYKGVFLSPITITLGDEFQSVIKSLSEAIEVIICIEETKLLLNTKITLRYVLYYGEIETEINEKIAHEMLGSGLTKSREILSNIKRGDNRIYVELHNEKSDLLNGLFFLYTSIVDKWKLSDFELVDLLIRLGDYKKVADFLKKDRGNIWRREKSLEIPQYLTTRKLIKEIAK